MGLIIASSSLSKKGQREALTKIYLLFGTISWSIGLHLKEVAVRFLLSLLLREAVAQARFPLLPQYLCFGRLT